MHSSRKHTARSSSHPGGSPHNHHPWDQAPPTSPRADPLRTRHPHWEQTPHPPGCGPGDPSFQPDPPKLLPWVWAWKPARHAGITPPPSLEPSARHAGIPPTMHAVIPPLWTDRHLQKHNLRKLRLWVEIKSKTLIFSSTRAIFVASQS